MPGILVGVDGSDHSRRALAWAMHQAVQRKIPLTVMNVHPGPVRPATHVYWNMPTLPDGGLSPEQTRAVVQEFVDKVAKEIGETPPEIASAWPRGIRRKNSSGPHATPTCSSWGAAAAAGSTGS